VLGGAFEPAVSPDGARLAYHGFTDAGFATLHPGGALGRRLLRVDEIMHVGDGIPVVQTSTAMPDALREMTHKRLGLTAVVDDAGRLAGILTDGDLRRAIERHGDLRAFAAGDLMTRSPKTVPAGALAERALAMMEEHSITSLFILDEEGRPAGVLHLHDLLRAGVV
jgi:arabinose-5-phosphate isomerase